MANEFLFDPTTPASVVFDNLIKFTLFKDGDSVNTDNILVHQPEEYQATEKDNQDFPLGLNTQVLLTNKTGNEELKRPVKMIYRRIPVSEIINKKTIDKKVTLAKEEEFTESNIKTKVAEVLGLSNYLDLLEVAVDGGTATVTLNGEIGGMSYVFIGRDSITVEKSK